jgi:hypothetical protein
MRLSNTDQGDPPCEGFHVAQCIDIGAAGDWVERLIRPVRHVDRMAVFELENRIPLDEEFLHLLLSSLQDTR